MISGWGGVGWAGCCILYGQSSNIVKCILLALIQLFSYKGTGDGKYFTENLSMSTSNL